MRQYPAWLEDAVFYEIYPQSFCDTNGDGIGDFPGIIDKLDYIKSLGCNAIWLNPCFASSFYDAGYDVSDFCMIAPRYGSNDDAKKLFDEAHKRGMHVLLDLVPGHTSVDHPWFRESMKAEKNEFTDRYVWTNSVWNAPSTSGISGWLRGFCDRDAACGVNFFSTQPALNYGFYQPTEPWQQPMDAPGPRATGKAMRDAVMFWLSLGCDGFRVDMAGSLVKNDPESLGTISFWQEFFSVVKKEYPDAAFVSEWGEPDKSLVAGFDMDFLLHFGPSHYMDLFRADPYFSRKGTGNIAAFVQKYLENRDKTNGTGLICIPSGNHDMARLASHLDDGERRLAFAFLMSAPGVPFIYYGDEIGMKHLHGIKSVEGGFGRTGARSPMQWTDDDKAGFSTANAEQFYIPLDPAQDRPTADAAMKDSASLLHEIKHLINLRHSHPALGNTGNITFLYAEENAYPLVYLREKDNEKVLIAINPSMQDTTVTLPVQGNGEVLYSHGQEASFNGSALTVPAESATFIKL